MKLEKTLFELSEEELSASNMMYNKVVKCLVAPYHTSKNIELDYSPNIFMFPENELTAAQTKQFISMVANSQFEEVLIITANMNIILDMIDGCVRILTEAGNIVHSPTKTFAANAHDIIYKVLNNESHQLSKAERSFAVVDVTKLINEIENAKSVTKLESDELYSRIERVGEEIIRYRLKEMVNEKTIKK